jgi:hypothetical protein
VKQRQSVCLVIVSYWVATQLHGLDDLVFASVTLPCCMLLDRANWHALISNVVVLTQAVSVAIKPPYT